MKSNLDNMRDQLNFLAEKLLSTSNKENLTQEQLINIQKQVSSLRNLKYEYNIDEQEKKEIKAIKDKPSQKDIQDLNVTYKRGNFASAEKKALELIKTYSDNPEVYEVLSLSCLKQKKYINAITFIKKAIEIDPNIDHYHVNLGLILRTMGRIEEAKAVYRKAININPNNYIVYNNLAFLFYKEKRFIEARENYIKSLNINSNYTKALNNFATVLMELGITEQTYIGNKISSQLNLCEEAISNLKITKSQISNIEKVLESFTKSLRLDPHQNEIWDIIHFPFYIIKYIKKNENNLLLNYFKNKELNSINFSLLNYQLNLGEEYSKDFFNNAIKTIKENTKSTITNPNYISEGAKQEVNLPKNMIALMHFGRSGTGFLHSLIDNHSEVSTLPSYYFNHFFNTSTWEDITKDGWDKMIDRFISSYEVFFDARVEKPVPTCSSFALVSDQGKKEGMINLGEDKKDFLFIDKKLFKKELSELVSRYKEIDTLIFFKLIHVAYERVLNNKNKNTIFYHIHNPDSCSKLNFAGLANDTKWLLTVRDPVEGTESWIYQHFMENDYKKVITKIISTLFTIDQPVFNENNSIGVRLDDLKQKPKETIAALCDWMGIKEEDTLYEMTAQGKKWWGDHSTPFLPAFGKVDKRKLGKVFSKKDKFILDTLVYPIRVKFNYTEENIEKFRKDLKTIRPMINEIFDFEKEIALKNNIDEKSFMISAFPCIFRTVLLNRWKILDKFNTYPNMLQSLQIL